MCEVLSKSSIMNEAMYHEPSKLRQLIKRIFVYLGMTIAVSVLVTLLVFYVLGYSFDRQQGTIEQNGLVQYVTVPSGATIEVDGTTLPNKTSAKSSVVAGQHEFVMWREGYETWRKTLSIEAGTLTWLNYARLVPKNRPIEVVASLPKVAATLTSQTRRFMAVLPDAAMPTVEFYDMQPEKVAHTSMTLTAADYTDANKPGVTHHFQFSEWDIDGRYLLVKHQYNDAIEWLVLDRQSGALRSNLTKTMDIAVTEAHFSGNSGNLLFVLSAGDVRKIDLSSATLSRPFVSDVAEFHFNNETNIVSYVSTYDEETKLRTVGLVRDSDKQPFIIKKSTSLPDVALHVDTSRYFSKDFFIVSEGKNVSIRSGNLPGSSADGTAGLKQFGSFEFSADVHWLQMSGNGRFVVAQTGPNFISYDLERKTVSPTSILSSDPNVGELRWLDDYYIWSDSADSLTMREFDGTNQHALGGVATGFDVSLTPDGTYLYSIGRAGAGFQLQRIKMIL